MARFFLNGMAIDTFNAHKRPPKGTVLFLNGLPAAIGPLPAVVAAMHSGWDVLFPQYPGTYDSEGELSVTSSVAALQELLTHMQLSKDVTPALDVESPSICIAHSFGAFQLMGLLRTMPGCGLKKAILLAPLVSYSVEPPSGTMEDLLSHLESVRISRPKTYRLKQTSEWNQIAVGNFPIASTGRWDGQFVCIIGSDDDTFDMTIAREAIPRLIAELTGNANVTMEVINDAGHGMDELIPASRQFASILGGHK